MSLLLHLALIQPAAALTVQADRPNGPEDIVANPKQFGDVNDADTYRERARLVHFRVEDVPYNAQVAFTFRIADGQGRLSEPFTTPDNFVRCPEWFDDAPKGAEDICWRAPLETQYQVTVDDGSQIAQTEVVVHDIWLASIGDSYSSGEGNPDIRSVPGWNLLDMYTSTEPEWRDADCHRSHLGWPFLVAQQVQADHPDAQVMFTYLACSGAQIREAGLLGPYQGVWQDADIAPQLDTVVSIMDATSVMPKGASDDDRAQFGYVDFHAPDALMMTGGGNDGGFSSVVSQCLQESCYDALDPVGRLKDVEDAAQELAQALNDAGIPYEQRFHLEYPDFTTIETWDPSSPYSGQRVIAYEDDCWSGNLDHLKDEDFFNLDEDIDKVESQHPYPSPDGLLSKNSGDRDFAQMYKELIEPASAVIEGQGTGIYVDGPLQAFWGHGICAEEDRWIRNLEESTTYQNYINDSFNLLDYGDIKNDRAHNLSTFGAYHPNEVGHQQMASFMHSPIGYTVADPWVTAPHRPDLDSTVWVDGYLLDDQSIAWNDDLFVIEADPRIRHQILIDGVPMDGGDQRIGNLTTASTGTRQVTIERAFVVPDLPELPLPAITFPLLGGSGFDVTMVHESTTYSVPARVDHPTFYEAYTWTDSASFQPTSILGAVDVTLEDEQGRITTYRATGGSQPPTSQFVGPGMYDATFCIAGTSRCGLAIFAVRDGHEDQRADFYVEFRGHLNNTRKYDYDPTARAMEGWPTNAGSLTNDVTGYVGMARDSAWAEVLDSWNGVALGRATQTTLDLFRDPGEQRLMVTACVNPLRGCIDGFGFGPGEVMLLSDDFNIQGEHSIDWWSFIYGDFDLYGDYEYIEVEELYGYGW